MLFNGANNNKIKSPNAFEVSGNYYKHGFSFTQRIINLDVK